MPCQSTICARQIKTAHRGSSALACQTTAPRAALLVQFINIVCVHCFLLYREKSTICSGEWFDCPHCWVFVSRCFLYGMGLFHSRGIVRKDLGTNAHQREWYCSTLWGVLLWGNLDLQLGLKGFCHSAGLSLKYDSVWSTSNRVQRHGWSNRLVELASGVAHLVPLSSTTSFSREDTENKGIVGMWRSEAKLQCRQYCFCSEVDEKAGLDTGWMVLLRYNGQQLSLRWSQRCVYHF